MNQPSPEKLPPAEIVLIDYVRRLDRFREGRRAVHVHLSRLKPYNRREHHLRIAAFALETMVRNFGGALFNLYNDDFLALCKGASVAEMDEFVLRLRYLFGEDPLLVEMERKGEEFCTWYDLEQEYDFLRAHVAELDAARMSHEAALAEADQEQQDQDPLPSTPLDPTRLATITDAIAQADLSSMLRRQAVCALVGDSKPETVFSELYISMDELRQTLMPTHDIQANRWLFQDLTRHLDLRMIALLLRSNDSTLRHTFSINLNIDTILSPEFLRFDAALQGTARRTIVIEMQLVDVFADIGNFIFARDFLHDRGYRICLDGTTHMSLPFVDRRRLDFDLVKLRWSSDLNDQLAGPRGQELEATIRDLSPERLILCRCDSEQAFELGRSLGIAMYQGFHVESRLLPGPSREESIKSMTRAVARNRAAMRG